ncbi:MAG: mechanosensitive ion channel protein, partial [Pseudomonadota bacterium]|nr:mechanosensitive ion channel protein [Pseudomonadota bacterium]
MPMVIHRFDIRELDQLLLDLTQPGAAAELAILALCLFAAWAVVRLLRGRSAPADSVWFGNRIVDGVFFPVLALVFAYIARVALETTIKPAVFRVAIPILISLVVLRLFVRVLTRTFPRVSWVRTVERSISWLAWVAVVLWVTGIAPMVLDEMDDVHWKVGAAQV